MVHPAAAQKHVKTIRFVRLREVVALGNVYHPATPCWSCCARTWGSPAPRKAAAKLRRPAPARSPQPAAFPSTSRSISGPSRTGKTPCSAARPSASRRWCWRTVSMKRSGMPSRRCTQASGVWCRLRQQASYSIRGPTSNAISVMPSTPALTRSPGCNRRWLLPVTPTDGKAGGSMTNAFISSVTE
jgi:hypothetical protein